MVTFNDPTCLEMAQDPIIPDRAEFVDALQALRKGHVLVHVHDGAGGSVLDGSPLYWSSRVLREYELVSEFDNPDGFPHVRYYRLNARGREFAERACSTWRQRPLIERLALRVAG